MSGIATAIVGSAIIGGIASNKASKRQSKSADRAIAAQNELIGPFSQAGQDALPALQDFVANGANFSDTQAFKDITNSAKAGGQRQSGNRLTALTDYYATNFRPQRFNELSFLPRLGANAAAGQATNVGNLNIQKGNAQAGGILGIGNSAISGINAFQFLNSGGGNSLNLNNSSPGGSLSTLNGVRP
jgi:hypothetical protein